MATQWFGVMGNPVEHSVSPAMVNAAFSVLKLDAVYLAFRVLPEAVTDAVRGLSALGASGVNVTIPHKQAVLPLVSQRSAEVDLAGAANTLLFHQDGTIDAHNTDIAGWWQSISPALPAGWTTAAVIGAGGAARAVLTALALFAPHCQVAVVARDQTKAAQLQRQFADRLSVTVHDWDDRGAAIAASDLAVNATSLGMWPKVDGCAVADGRCFHTGQVVQDLVYVPLETRWLQLAREQGARCVDGLGMLVGQGVAAVKLWTGLDAPADVMRAAAETALRDR